MRSSLILLAASLINVSPYLFRNVDADVWIYLTRIDCFSQAFWLGDIYPRWCLNANAGLGSPVFVFYFPLAFYIAALLHPLTHLGVTLYALFALLCFMATGATALACYSWLRDVVKPPYALLASILFLFMPYRLETMFFRGAYAEIWFMALLPLLFKYTRRIACGQGGMVALALVIGLSLLTHVPDTAIALIFCGFYIVLAGKKTLAPKVHYAIASLWGIALAAFYLVPGWYYGRFLASDTLVQGVYGWANGFLTLAYLHTPGLERPAMAAVLMAMLLVAVLVHVLARMANIEDAAIRREVRIWAVMGALALFMLIPTSAPFYALMGPFARVVFPWRMQIIVMMAITYVLAIRMQYLFSAGRKTTWKLDYFLAVFFLWLVGNVLVVSYGKDAEALNDKLVAQQIVFAREYRTQWMDDDHWDYPYLLEQHAQNSQKASIIKGEGSVKVIRWGWNGIELQVQSKKPMTLRLEQLYFPTWQAALYKGDNVVLTPEEKTGRILLETPVGEHIITLTANIWGGNENLIVSQWVSFAALIAMVALAFRHKHFDNL